MPRNYEDGQNEDQLTSACCATMRLVKMKDHLTSACHATMRLVEMKDQLTSACRATMRLVKMKDQLTSTCCATMRLVEMKNQLTDTCCIEMRLVEIILKDEVSYFIKKTLDATDGSLKQVTYGSNVMNSSMRQSAMLAKTYVINWTNVVVMKFICSHQQKYKNTIFGYGQCLTKGYAFVHVELYNKHVVPLLEECHPMRP